MKPCRYTAAAFALAVSAVAPLSAQAPEPARPRPFVVDDYLGSESIVRARLTDSGRLLYEKQGASAASSHFRPYTTPYYPPRNASRLYTTQSNSENAPAPLALDFQDNNYRLGDLSDSQEYVTFVRAGADRSVLGAYDLRADSGQVFDLTLPDGFAPLWVSSSRIATAYMPRTQAPSAYSEQLHLAWRAAEGGQTATPQVIGSGAWARDETERGLAIVDVATGSIDRVLNGVFVDRSLSPRGGTWLALLQQRHDQSATNAMPLLAPVERRQLVLLNLGTRRPFIACNRCDILPGSLSWSPSGERVAFLAREPGQPWRQARLWLTEARTGTTRAADFGLPIDLPPDDLGTLTAPTIYWLGDDPVVRVRRGVDSGTGTDWVRLGRGVIQAIPLSAGANQPEALVGTDDGRLILLARGELWSLDDRGRSRNLTGEIPDPIARLWRVGGRRLTVGISAQNGATSGSAQIAFIATHGDSQAIYGLNVATNRINHLVDLPPGAAIMDISVACACVAFSMNEGRATALYTATYTATGQRRVLVERINTGLRNVAGGQPFRIQVPQTGGTSESWILMPPGWRPEDGPVPTVVEVYPGRTGASLYRNAHEPLDSPSADRQLLAAHGFAVLFPNLPLPANLPRDTLPGLADRVNAVVDAAALAGFTRNDRVALYGRSYGGFGVLGIIGQTMRYAAAISVSGLSDEFSLYGTRNAFGFEWENRWNLSQYAARTESQQEGMGAPPWLDPERYLRNSPIMRVGSIQTPVMLIHGDRDDTLPADQSLRMFNALYRSDKDAELVLYRGEGHGVPRSPANARDMWHRIFAWYAHYLGQPFDVEAALRRLPSGQAIAPTDADR